MLSGGDEGPGGGGGGGGSSRSTLRDGRRHAGPQMICAVLRDLLLMMKTDKLIPRSKLKILLKSLERKLFTSRPINCSVLGRIISTKRSFQKKTRFMKMRCVSFT